MKSYEHFTLEERECLRIKLSEGKSYRQIARELNRDVSSISRELKRNRKKDGTYNAIWGQSMYRYRRKRCVRPYRLETDHKLRDFVTKSLDKYWSPEIIAARWQGKEFSPSTIYRALKQKRLFGYSERTHLRRRGILKYCRGDNRTIRPEHTIHERSDEINNRQRIGDWEGDIVLGGPGKGGLVTMVERKSRYLAMELLPNKEAATVEKIICSPLCKTLPIKSITFDNGSEFANFRKIGIKLNAIIYFADTRSPWQRGSNENINGLVRFFFPKGTDFRTVSPEKVAHALSLINQRPRKCLGWMSPLEFIQCCT
ncbi:MAG: IS30 family transposase [Oscillospiraceae bacterium]|nr:IS30 family transposase [Oscillospiraceae bacterium]